MIVVSVLVYTVESICLDPSCAQHLLRCPFLLNTRDDPSGNMSYPISSSRPTCYRIDGYNLQNMVPCKT